MAFAPAILWGWAYYHSNRYKRSNLKALALLYGGGMSCGLIALLLNHMVEKYTIFWPGAPEVWWAGVEASLPLASSGFWLMVGVNEEFAKMLVLLLGVYTFREPREPFDGLLFAAVIALGFATIENLFYLNQYGPGVLVTRSVVTVPAHAFMSAPMGYIVVRSRMIWEAEARSPQAAHRAMLVLLGGWLVSASLHGAYDLWLSLGYEWGGYLQIVLMGLLSVWLGRRALKESPFRPGLSAPPV
jgi:RsiW-degrading membrane proteinase PrsW (M82 family)